MSDARTHPKSAAAAAAFLGDKISLRDLEHLRGLRDLNLGHGPAAYALDGDANALVQELVRLARIGLLVGAAAQLDPARPCADVLADVERKMARPG